MKKGDRVKLVTDRHGLGKNNPIFGSKFSSYGTIYKISNSSIDMPILVVWDGGKGNCYSEDDLELCNNYNSIW